MSVLDPLELSRVLIRCESVTPAEGGAQGVLARVLEPLGFVTDEAASGPIRQVETGW